MLFSDLNPFGKEVKGLSVKTIAPEQVSQLKQRLAESGVLVIRDQSINDSAFVRFLKRLGPLMFTTGEVSVEGQPLLNVVTNVGRSCPPQSVFHTDTSYIPAPPAYTALRAITLPTAGGETLFCNQYQAFESLPLGVRDRLQNTQVLHAVTGLTLLENDISQTWHPLFRKHPLSGRTALFLSTPKRCQQLSNLSDDVRAIRLLYQHSIRPHRIYRHVWQADDIVIWDNRCTMHRADHSGVVGDRTLHRGLISGEAPIPANA